MEKTISQLIADGILFLEDAAREKSQAEAANATTTTTPATLAVNEYATFFDGSEDGLDMDVMNFDPPNATTATAPPTQVANEYAASFDVIDMDAINFDLPSSPFNDHNYCDRIEDFPLADIDAVFAGDELFTSDDLEAAFNRD